MARDDTSVSSWERLARELGGELGDTWIPFRRRMTIPRHGTVVTCQVDYHNDGYRYGVALGMPAMTQLQAPYLLPFGPRIRLLREGTFRMWLRQFGYQDLQIGHARFDQRYIVKGGPLDAVRRVLDPVAGELVELADRVLWMGSSRDRVDLNLVADYDPAAVADWSRQVDLVAAMASADLFGIAALRDLPAAEIRWTTPPSPPVVTIRAPGPIELSVSAADGRPRTFARTPLARDRAAFSVTLGSVDLPFAVPAQLSSLIAQLDGADVECDDTTVTLTWPGICEQQTELLAGAHLVARLSSGEGHAPYR